MPWRKPLRRKARNAKIAPHADKVCAEETHNRWVNVCVRDRQTSRVFIPLSETSTINTGHHSSS